MRWIESTGWSGAINSAPNTKYIFFLGLLFTFVILCIDANFQYLTGKNFFGFEPQKTPLRISGMFKDELILGSFLSRLFPLLVGLFFLFFNQKKFFLLKCIFLSKINSFSNFNGKADKKNWLF